MLNTEKLKNVLTSYCKKNDENTFRLNITTDISNNCLDKAIISYIENGYAIKEIMKTTSYSYAVLFNKHKTIFIGELFKKNFDVNIKKLRGSSYLFSLFYTWFKSLSFSSLFGELVHISIDSFIPNKYIKIRCMKCGISVYVSASFDNENGVLISIEE